MIGSPRRSSPPGQVRCSRSRPRTLPRKLWRGRRIVEQLQNNSVSSILALYAANAAFAIGHYETMRAEYELGIELGARSGNHMYECLSLALLAARSASLDDDPREMFHEAITRLRIQVGVLYWALTGLADWWASTGETERAGRVIGFLDHQDPHGHPTVADLRGHAAWLVEQDHRASTWRAVGAVMSRDEMVEYCLEQLDRP